MNLYELAWPEDLSQHTHFARFLSATPPAVVKSDKSPLLRIRLIKLRDVRKTGPYSRVSAIACLCLIRRYRVYNLLQAPIQLRGFYGESCRNCRSGSSRFLIDPRNLIN